MTENQLYYGDNLDILREHIHEETVDLIYLDPPFNSNATYNVLFHEQDGRRSAAQIKAFTDTWQWDVESVNAYNLLANRGGKVGDALRAFYHMLGDNNMMAYLAMMAPRLVELHRVLKPTGSLYLHCDPTASHYLKLLLDAIFGPENFRNEIIWQRTSSHNDSKKWGAVHDVILNYSKTDYPTWNPTYTGYSQAYLDAFYTHEDSRGRFRLDHIIRSATMGPRPNLSYEYKGYKPVWGWRVVREKLELLDRDDRIEWSRTGRPYLKRYLNEQKGTPIKDVVIDIQPLSAQSAEKLGYPTQKPEALLDRIIQASSNPGDVVLDPFCGCGTAVSSAQKLGRNWIGIDITYLAVDLIKRRMKDSYDLVIKPIGEPTTVDEAEKLANEDPFQFQVWSVFQLGGYTTDIKKGSDRGIDGHLYFQDEGLGKEKEVIISVKAGKPTADHIRVLQSVVEREKAQIGVLVTMQEPTKTMRAEAAGAGVYESPFTHTCHPKIQILTIADLFAGKRIDIPIAGQQNVTFKQAPKRKQVSATQLDMVDQKKP